VELTLPKIMGPKITGGCLCGAIRYAIDAEPLGGGYCHCRDCQYRAGGGPATVIVFPREAYHLTQGAPRAYWSVSDRGVRVARLFCPKCGTGISTLNADHPQIIPISVGSLDDPTLFKPLAHIWTRSAPPWHGIDRSLICYEGDAEPAPPG
jgi:hypothetical protein